MLIYLYLHVFIISILIILIVNNIITSKKGKGISDLIHFQNCYFRPFAINGSLRLKLGDRFALPRHARASLE